MRKFLSLLAVLVLCNALVYAQTKEVTGKVTDVSGGPVAGATVKVRGSRTGVSADQEGFSKLTVPTNATLVVSGIGFETREIKVSNNSVFTVQLTTDAKALSEVVVTGVGVATSKKKVPIDVATLASKDVAKSALGSVEQALVGKIAGAEVQFNSGTPGSGATIILRGLNSLGSSYPLIMVDGVEVSDLNGLDLGNVDRVEVVKGAAAGMLYGAQGANGVIQVFTKKGAHNRKPEINITSQASSGNVLKGNNMIAKYHSFETDAQGFATLGGARVKPDVNGSWPAPDFLNANLDPTVQNN